MSKSRFRDAFEWGNNVHTLWGLLPAAWQTVVTGGFTAVTAYFGFYELGWARAIFYSSGVLAFGMTTVFLSLRISQIMGMFQRLSAAGFGIGSVSISKNHTEISAINMHVVLRNDSQRPLFYSLRRMNAVLGRQNMVGDAVDHNVIIIPAFGGTQLVAFSTIEQIPLKKFIAEGRLEIEIDYGPARDELIYRLHQVVTVHLTVTKGVGSTPAQAGLHTQIKALEHHRNRS